MASRRAWLFRWRRALGVTPVTAGGSFLSVKLADEVVVAPSEASAAPPVIPPPLCHLDAPRDSGVGSIASG